MDRTEGDRLHRLLHVVIHRRIGARAQARALADPDYEGDRVVVGYAASGVSADGQAILAVAAEGGQLSNDHYPTYEVIADPAGNVVRSRVFFWDFAGVEGFEYPLMLAVLVVGGVLACVPVTAGWVVFAARRRRRASP